MKGDFMKRYLLTLCGVSLLSVSPAYAAVETYELDKPHTQIMFFADHVGFTQSSGKFLDYKGEFQWDPAQPEKAKAQVTIDVNSLDMGDEAWDKELKGPHFFDVEKYPTMSFVSTSVKVVGKDEADVAGDLTMHGQTHPVVLHVRHNKTGRFPMGEIYASGFTATASLDRAGWGMDYGAPLMSTNVDLRIEVEGHRTPKGGTENQ
jgi:polyisoprenoid-binding protein YceI